MIILRIAELLHTAPYLTLLPKKDIFILSEMSKKFVVFEGIEYHSVRKKGSRHFDRLQTANFRHVPGKMTGLMRSIFEYVIYKENSRITG